MSARARYWSDRVADVVKPTNIVGHMGMRARLWRCCMDWGWGIELGVPILTRLRWCVRRLAPGSGE